MSTAGGGWGLLEKTTAGSAGLFNSGGAAFKVDSLASPAVSKGKVSDADMKTLLGSSGGSLLWRNMDTGTFKFLYFDASFWASTWSSSFRYNYNYFYWYDFSAKTWKRINGHYNNVHFSDYSDGTPDYGTGYTSDNTGSSEYRHFHTGNSQKSKGNYYSFYFREGAKPENGFY